MKNYVIGCNTVRLKLGSALKVLKETPDETLDLVVTDPAYSGMNNMLKLGKGRIVGNYGDKAVEEGDWFEEFRDDPENYRDFLQECYRVLKQDRHIYIMFDSYSLLTLGPVVREVFNVKNIICWDKVNIGMGHYFRRRHEFIMFASKGKRPLNARNLPDIWEVKRLHRAEYPTQKPVELFQLMILASCEPGDLICDPFMGSGSSAIAALKMQCDYLGMDISSRAFEITSNRIESFSKTGQDILQKKSHIMNETFIEQFNSF